VVSNKTRTHAVVVVALLALPLFCQDAPPAKQAGAAAPSAVRATAAPLHVPKLTQAPALEDFEGMKPATPLAQQMTKIDVFLQLDPKEGAPAQERTEAYLGYDSKNFYVVWLCFDREPKKIRALLARRDTIGPEHDEVQLYLDTFNDRRRSYGFMANPLGVQYDYIWTDNNGYDASYDTVWDSKGKVTDLGYVVWMAIPFKSLRFYKQPDQTWGILLQRVIPHHNDNSFYPALTRKIQGRLTQEAHITGLSGITPGRNIQLTPYAIATNTKFIDQRDPSRPYFRSNSLGGDAGLDAKVILHDSLVLDMTFNPDFRQVESDEPQTTVNQRFEVFFPEKRPFFQENANFFSTPIDLYFTRRIVDPQFGLRLTGKLGAWNLGLLSIDDQAPGRIVPDDDPLRRKRAYFNVARITHDIGKQSHLGVIYADRRFSADAASMCRSSRCQAESNVVGGVDGRFRIGEHFNAEFQVVESATDFADGTHKAGPSTNLWAEWSTKRLVYNVMYQDTAAGFETLTGFFRRPDIRRESHFFSYRDYHENKWLQWWGPQVFHVAAWDHTGNLLEYNWEPGISVVFSKNTNFGILHGFTTEKLRPQDFGPPVTSDLYFNKGYWYTWVDMTYFKRVAVHANLTLAKAINFAPPAGQLPFLANETNAFLLVTVRPFGNLTVDNTYIIERLRDRESAASILNFHVLRSKWNYQFTKELSVRTIFQYTTLLANPALSSLQDSKQFNADFLVSYLIHPGTAVYFGYNSDLANIDRVGVYTHTGIFPTRNRFLNDGRGFFAKASYQFRF
jgi:hypothetical protein